MAEKKQEKKSLTDHPVLSWEYQQKKESAMNEICWSRSSLLLRLAVVELCGWENKKGKATPTGKRIARTSWENLSSAAKRVLLQAGVGK